MRRSDKVTQKIDEKIRGNLRITQRQLARKLGFTYGTVNEIIKKMNYRRIYAKWVPKLLTTDMKAARKEVVEQLLARYYREAEEFMRNIVTGYESWARNYDPELKEQSSKYQHTTSPGQKKIRTERATGKLMLLIFWDSEVVVYRERQINTMRKLKR